MTAKKEWWAVTYRGTAEMVVWIEASSPAEAKLKAEEFEYEDATDVEFVRGKPYTMKARRAPDYQPPDELQ